MEITLDEDVADVSRSPRLLRWIFGAVGVVLLLGAVGFAVTQLRASDGGAGSPEEAVDQFLEAVEAADMLAIVEVLEPAERDSFGDSMIEMMDELERLDILDEAATEPGFPGIELAFTDVTYEVTELESDLALVTTTGGSVTGHVEPSLLPIGEWILESVDPSDFGEPEEFDDDLGTDELRMATVERNGSWYVSLYFSVAENARLEADMDYPVAQRRPEPIGAETPTQLVQDFTDASAAFDIERLIGLLDPVEADALYRYSPLFLDEFDSEEITAALDAAGVTYDVEGIVYDAKINGSEGEVEIVISDDFVMEIRMDELPGVVARIDRQCMGAKGVIEGTDFDVAICPDGGLSREGFENFADDLWALLDVRGPDLSVFDVDLSQHVSVVERDGRWYMRPARTYLRSLTRPLASVDRAEIEALIDEFERFGADMTEIFQNNIDDFGEQYVQEMIDSGRLERFVKEGLAPIVRITIDGETIDLGDLYDEAVETQFGQLSA